MWLSSKLFGKSLAKAIINQDLNLLATVIKRGCDINAKYVFAGKRITPLVQAAIYDNEKMVDLLLKAGADPNYTMDNGETALMNAAQNGNCSIVKTLLESGADPNAIAYTGTALAVAHDESIIDLLCNYGADPNIPDADGDLPIVGFIAQHDRRGVHALLAHGSDPHHRNKNGKSAYDWAVHHGNESIIELLTSFNPHKISDWNTKQKSPEPQDSEGKSAGDAIAVKFAAYLEQDTDRFENIDVRQNIVRFNFSDAFIRFTASLWGHNPSEEYQSQVAVLFKDNARTVFLQCPCFLIPANTPPAVENAFRLFIKEEFRYSPDKPVSAYYVDGFVTLMTALEAREPLTAMNYEQIIRAIEPFWETAVRSYEIFEEAFEECAMGRL